MIFLCKIMFVMLTFQTEIDSVKFIDISINLDEEVLIKKLFSVMGKVYSICFWDDKKSSHDLSGIIFNQCFEKYIAITVESTSNNFVRGCDVFVFLNVSSSDICGLFLKNKIVYLTFEYKIVIISLSDDYLQTEHCSSRFDSANVTIITLQPEVLVLDSPNISPRRLRPLSSINHTGSTLSLNKLHGRVINVATFHYPPFIELRRIGNLVEYHGMEMTLWKEVSRYLNFTWKLVQLQEGWEWGVTLENGTLVGGIIHALGEGNADVSFCNIWQRDVYLNIMDFGPPLNKISLTFLVRRPHQLSDRWQNLFTIFQTDVWLTTLVALLAISVVYWRACALDVSVSSTKTSLAESLLVMFGILTVSSSYVRSTSTNVKVVVLGWFFFTLLFTTAITSTIVTRLTLPLYSPRINTFQQLVEGDFYWTSTHYQGLSTTHREFYFDVNNFWQVKFESRYRYILPKYVEKLLKTDVKLVLPAQRWGSEYVIINSGGVSNATDLSNFRVMRSSTRDTFTSFAFRKRSPYNELFTRTIQSFIQLGLWSYWRKNTDQTAVRKYLLVEQDISSFSEPEQLTMQKMYPVFLLLFIGNIIVLIIFFIEFYYRG